MEKVEITEENISDMLNADTILEELYEKAVEIKDSVYIPGLREFLAKLTVSCFSVSGWDNQLMWSHYANSYAGICIEYDFNQIKEPIGFIYPVEYTKERPTLSLQDLGIIGFSMEKEGGIKSCEPNMEAILSYLLAKNICWNYEQEWRIINVGEENTPLFIDLPFVKSITFGMNIDPICKHLLWDLCKEKEIECYEIEVSTENFELSRRKLLETRSHSKKDIGQKMKKLGMMKTILMMGCALALLFAAVPQPVMAANSQMNLTVGTTNDAKAGDTVTVRLVGSNNPGLSTFAARLAYDDSDLEYVGTTWANTISSDSGNIELVSPVTENNQQALNLSAILNKTYSQNETIATVTFKAKNAYTTMPVTLTVREVTDASYNPGHETKSAHF